MKNGTSTLGKLFFLIVILTTLVSAVRKIVNSPQASSDPIGRLIDPVQEHVRICVTDSKATVINFNSGQVQYFSASKGEGIYVHSNSNGRQPFPAVTPSGNSLSLVGLTITTSDNNKYVIWAMATGNAPMYFEAPKSGVATNYGQDGLCFEVGQNK